MDIEAFNAIQPILEITEMDNGEYTLGKVTEDEQGVRTVHYLNVNVRKLCRCDLCGGGEDEDIHNCPESDPGDPFAQPITEDGQAWLDFLSAE